METEQLRKYRSKEDVLPYLKYKPAIWKLKMKKDGERNLGIILAISGYYYIIFNTLFGSTESSPIEKTFLKAKHHKNAVENEDRCSVHLLQVSNLRCMCKLASLSSPRIQWREEAAPGADSSAHALPCTVAQPVSFRWLPAELGSQFRQLKLNA